jgi:hypothetical protein
MTEDNTPVVTLEIAKSIKAQGFDIPCKYFYQDKDLSFSKAGLKHCKNNDKMNHNAYDDFIYSAPTMIEFLEWNSNRKQMYVI